MIHSSFSKGSKIRIILKTGEIIIAKFDQKLKSGQVRTNKGDFRIRDVRSMNYYKPLPHEIGEIRL